MNAFTADAEIRRGYAAWPFVARAAALCLLIACIFFCWRMGYRARSSFGNDTITYYLNGSFPTAADYSAMQDVEIRSGSPVSFSLWTEQGWQVVRDPLTQRATGVSAVLVKGDTRLALPVSATLALDDYTGCLIDKETSLELFGTANSAGATLQYGDAAYTVRNVFDGPAGTMLLQLPPTHTAPLTNITVIDSKDASAFVQRHGLVTGYNISSACYRTVSKLVGDLPVMVLIVTILEFLLALRHTHRHYTARNTVFTLLLLCTVTVSVTLLLAAMPASFVPSRWSDFSFWGASIKKLKEDAALYFIHPKHKQDLVFLKYAALSLWGLLSALLLLALRRYLYRRQGSRLLR